MTVLSRISVHFGATQRTQGETLHTRKTGNTDGGEVSVDLKDKSRTTLHNSITPHSKTTTTIKKSYIWLETPASTANTKIQNQRKTSEDISDIKNLTSLPHRTENLSNTQSRHTPVETQVCTNSF